MQIEFDAMEKLDLSLKLFEEAVAIGDEMCSGMTTTDIVALVHSIIFAASVYTASLKVFIIWFIYFFFIVQTLDAV